MAKRLVDYDPLTGVSTYFNYDHSTDTSIVSSEQDVSAVIEANKILQNSESYTKKGMKASWWHYASIPNIVIEKWKNEYGVNVFDKNHEKRVFRLLNQPEYRYLKTTTKMHRG